LIGEEEEETHMTLIFQEGLQDDENNLFLLFKEMEKLFTEIVQKNWDMEKLYADLSFAKQQLTLGKEKELTPIEKQYLHSLLVLHSQLFRFSLEKREELEAIREKREELEVIKTILETSTINLYRYIEIITLQPNNILNGWGNAAKLLEDADYRKSRFIILRSKIKESDAEILKASIHDLGITFKTNADVRGSGGMRVYADIVVVLEGKFDIGWVLNKDGYFDLVADWWGVAKKHNHNTLINSIHQKLAVNKTLA
jgi:hypothetical protein